MLRLSIDNKAALLNNAALIGRHAEHRKNYFLSENNNWGDHYEFEMAL
jgi:hypothetical protein